MNAKLLPRHRLFQVSLLTQSSLFGTTEAQGQNKVSTRTLRAAALQLSLLLGTLSLLLETISLLLGTLSLLLKTLSLLLGTPSLLLGILRAAALQQRLVLHSDQVR